MLYQMLCWQATDSSPKQQEYFRLIADWWAALDGQIVFWECFDDCHARSLVPLVTYQVQIEQPCFHENALYWSKAGTTQRIRIVIQRAIVDLLWQRIEFIPECQPTDYIPISRYRVKCDRRLI